MQYCRVVRSKDKGARVWDGRPGTLRQRATFGDLEGICEPRTGVGDLLSETGEWSRPAHLSGFLFNLQGDSNGPNLWNRAIDKPSCAAPLFLPPHGCSVTMLS